MGFHATRRLIVVCRTLAAVSWIPTFSRMLSNWIGRREYTEEELAAADGAPPEWVARRRSGFDALARRLQERFPRSNAWGSLLHEGLSDLRFTDATRVPFPFAAAMRRRFDVCSVVTTSNGPWLETLDGPWMLDVGGSYGVNVAGYARYKEWIRRGWRRVEQLGAVLGPLHPLVSENVASLKSISGL